MLKTENIVQPEWIDSYCFKREALSGCVEKLEYTFQNEYGSIYACKPYPGVHLWMNDVHMHSIPTERPGEYHFIKLNYCAEGRSEVLLEDERYVYLEKGTLSIDSNAPKENFLFPGGRYAGLELVLDLEMLAKVPIPAFCDCGIDPLRMKEEMAKYQGSYLVSASGEWRELAERVMKKLENGEGEAEDYRFLTLQLLYLLRKTDMVSVEKKFYLTKGQRLIVTKVEEKISRNLNRRYTVEELAAEHGVSPSSLKKYFGKVYGMAISDYIREKRMERACTLLSQTRMSVADVAAEAGYGNQGKFGSAFKKYAQKSPLEYRRCHSSFDEA